MNLAPTTSTIVAMAIGDSIAMAVSQARNFGASDFARYHPGGRLGERLMTEVGEVMRTQDLPTASPETPLKDLLSIISRGRLGMALIMDESRLVGVVTDGDVRRALERRGTLEGVNAEDVMTKSPLTISPQASVFDADELMRERQVTALVVTEPHGPLLGVLKIHD